MSLPWDNWLELHGHGEGAALAYTGRVDTNIATVILDYLLHDVKTEADAFVIHFSGPLQLTKAREKQRHIYFCYTMTRVFHVYFEPTSL